MTQPNTRLIPIKKWNEYHDWPPNGGLRHLAFYRKTNGFQKAFKKIGRAMVVDERAFFECVNEQDSA